MSNLVGPGTAALSNTFGQGQTWRDRVREAAYTAPETGTRLRFDFEDVSREVTLRGTVHEFPKVNDAYVQRTGYGARRYPLRCFFSGPNHDLLAAAFESALLEHGAGRLEHPFYGPLTVAPLGDNTRRDDLKTAANQTIIEVTFWTTVGAVYPSSRADPQNEIAASLVGFNTAAAEQYDRSTRLGGALQRAASRGTVRSFLKSIKASVGSIAATTDSVAREFREMDQTIDLGIDTLLSTPSVLAANVLELIQIPALAVVSVADKLAEYEQLLEDILDSRAADTVNRLNTGTNIETRSVATANDFHTSSLAAMGAVSGAIRAVTNHKFATKPEALDAAERISDMFDDVVVWREAGFEALAAVTGLGPMQVDTGEAYQALQASVALVLGFLVQVSFQVVPELRIVLDRRRTIVDLAAQLYGSVDDKLDLLINSNDLTGSEILELPAGRLIKYYPVS